jgi:hypothetical protein
MTESGNRVIASACQSPRCGKVPVKLSDEIKLLGRVVRSNLGYHTLISKHSLTWACQSIHLKILCDPLQAEFTFDQTNWILPVLGCHGPPCSQALIEWLY